MAETVRDVVYRWKDASPEERQQIERENPKLGDMGSLLRTLETTDRIALAAKSQFGMTEAAEVAARTVGVVMGITREDGKVETIAFDPDELAVICDALMLALPSYGEEVRAVLTIEARFKIMDALGIDERTPADPMREVEALLADEYSREVPPPGKFEGAFDVRVAARLHTISLDGTDDEFGSSSDSGSWHGRIGRFLVEEDSQGFFGYEVFETEEEAVAAFGVRKNAYEEGRAE